MKNLQRIFAVMLMGWLHVVMGLSQAKAQTADGGLAGVGHHDCRWGFLRLLFLVLHQSGPGYGDWCRRFLFLCRPDG